MSVHYDYVITCEIPHTLSQQIVDTLRYMTRTEDYPFDAHPDHPFFEGEDFGDAGTYEAWRHVLRIDPYMDQLGP